MNQRRLLMISTDRKIFEEGSAVRNRQIEYAKDWDEVHIIVFAGRDMPGEQSISPNCFVYSTKSSSKFMYPFNATTLGRFIIPGRKITNITCQDSSLTAMAGVTLKKEFKLPLEIQLHEDIGSPNYGFRVSNRIRKMLAFKYIPQADHVRVVSERIKDFLLKAALVKDAAMIEVRPINVDTGWLSAAPVSSSADLHKKYPSYEKIVLMASRLEREKNVELAIEAWTLVLKKIPKAGLVIVGEGSRKDSLIEMARKLGILDSVVFEPWADQLTLASYYKTADLFLNTSLFEGYGMTLKEASIGGTKIVSTDVGIAREIGATIVDVEPQSVADGILASLRV